MNPSLDRRQLLRNGGLVVSMGALIAACGSNRGGVEAPGRLGVADAGPDGVDATVNDIVLLRTAQSLEYTALDLYAAAGELDVLDGAAASLAGRFVEDHTGHAARIGALITDLGGEEFTCANPFLVDRAVGPALEAIAGSDDQLRDVLNVAYAFEEFAGRSYQALVSAISGDNRGARAEAMRVGGDEQRHAAALARAINPDETINPTLVGGEAMDADAEGFPIPYAIPSVFGQLTGVPVVLGAPNDEGARYSATLQTPAQNSFVYEELSC